RPENGQGARYHQDGPDDREKSDAVGSARRRALARVRFKSAGHGTNDRRRWRDRDALSNAWPRRGSHRVARESRRAPFTQSRPAFRRFVSTEAEKFHAERGVQDRPR